MTCFQQPIIAFMLFTLAPRNVTAQDDDLRDVCTTEEDTALLNKSMNPAQENLLVDPNDIKFNELMAKQNECLSEL